ncbi:hypothetical protein [Marinilactibacillus psychrotolerans]
MKKPTDISSTDIKEIFQQALEIEGAFKEILCQNEKIKFIKDNMNSVSNADEISKLHILLINGVLTKEEFALQKKIKSI